MGPAGMAYPADLMTRTVLHIFVVLEEMMWYGICIDVVCVRLRVTRAATRLRLYKACFRVLVTLTARRLRNSLNLISRREID